MSPEIMSFLTRLHLVTAALLLFTLHEEQTVSAADAEAGAKVPLS